MSENFVNKLNYLIESYSIHFPPQCGLIAKPHTRCQLLITLNNNFGFIDFTKKSHVVK